MTETTALDWPAFLLKWSEEWADSVPADRTAEWEDEGTEADAGDEEEWDGWDEDEDKAAWKARWLGFPPASEERITAMEERLGRRMPPSYREFLKVSDGWLNAGEFIGHLAGTEHARWHNDSSGIAGMIEQIHEERGEEIGPEKRRELDIWRRGLQLDVESDALHVLLYPEDADEDGEWPVYTWASWWGEPAQRHANFLAFMRAMYEEFRSAREL